MITVRKDGKKIAQYRTMEQVIAWAARIGLDIEECTVGFDRKLINHNEWTAEDYR